MPRYRVTDRSYINGNLEPVGAIVDYDGIPGSNLEPLDDEAHAAKEAAEAGRARRAGMRSVDGKRPIEPPPGRAPLPPQVERELVPIPDDWRELPQSQRINLARRLGAPAKGTGTEQANKTIETELARRATV